MPTLAHASASAPPSTRRLAASPRAPHTRTTLAASAANLDTGRFKHRYNLFPNFLYQHYQQLAVGSVLGVAAVAAVAVVAVVAMLTVA